MNLPTRIENTLEKAGYWSVGQVIAALQSHTHIQGIGPESTGLIADALGPLLAKKTEDNSQRKPVEAPNRVKHARSGRKVIEASLHWIEKHGGETGLVDRRIKTAELGIQRIFSIGSEFVKNEVSCAYLYLE